MAASSSALRDILLLGENSIRYEESPQNTKKQPISKARRRRPPGTPRENVVVVALTPRDLTTDRRFECKECLMGFNRRQNLVLHSRTHSGDGKLMKRDVNAEPSRKRVYVCPEPSCVHHDPARALGDITGIKKHYARKHTNDRRFRCKKCDRAYAVKDDLKAHAKKCRARPRRERLTDDASTSNPNPVTEEQVPTFSLQNFVPLSTNSEAFLDRTTVLPSPSYPMVHLSPELPMDEAEENMTGYNNNVLNEGNNNTETSNNISLVRMLEDEPLDLNKAGDGEEGSNPYQYNDWMDSLNNISSTATSLSEYCYELFENSFGGLRGIGSPVNKNR